MKEMQATGAAIQGNHPNDVNRAAISVSRFTVGGPPIIHTHNEKKINEKIGHTASPPPIKTRLRVCSRL